MNLMQVCWGPTAKFAWIATGSVKTTNSVLEAENQTDRVCVCVLPCDPLLMKNKTNKRATHIQSIE